MNVRQRAKLTRLGGVAFAVAALVPASVAAAGVPATGSTRTAILKAAVGAYASHPACFAVTLASDKSPWAFVRSSHRAGHLTGCRDVQIGDYSILHDGSGGWKTVSADDELSCPIPSRPGQPKIPAKIVRQLTGLHCSQTRR